MKIRMKSVYFDNTKGEITGTFFILATVSAIIGVKLYDPILLNEDFLIITASKRIQILTGAFFELIVACSAIGTGFMLYSKLQKYQHGWGLGYALFRLLEAICIVIGVMAMLLIANLSSEYVNSSGSRVFALQITGDLLKSLYKWAFVLGPHFMLGINTFIYSLLFYKYNLVPKPLSLLGIFGAVFIFIGALLEIFGVLPHFSTQIIILALPIALYEMILAGWLIIKGYNK